MLSTVRFAGVLKKLQLNDLTKYLIGRLVAVERKVLDSTSVAELNQSEQRLQQNSKDSHDNQLQTEQLLSSRYCSASRNHIGKQSVPTGLVSAGQAFGNCSNLGDLANTRTSAHVQHQQQTVARELEENIQVSDCDQVMESMSAADKHKQTQVEALKAAAAAAASNSSSSSDSCPGASSPADIIKFLELVGSLKHIKRTGWVMRNVKDCESISGHMYRMGMMTYLLDGKDGLDRTKCLELAMVHDLAECVVGDITPFCGVSREEKKMRELQAMEDICKLIEPYGRKILELFQEYENAESPESKFVKDLDRLDMVLQAFEYEKRDDCVMKHQEFFDSTDGKFGHPFVRQLIDEINTQRRALAIEKQAKLIANGNATANGFTNGHHVNGDITDNGDSRSHHEDMSGAKKASTS